MEGSRVTFSCHYQHYKQREVAITHNSKERSGLRSHPGKEGHRTEKILEEQPGKRRKKFVEGLLGKNKFMGLAQYKSEG